MCTSPLILHRYGTNPETGKPYTKIKSRIDYSLADYYKLYGRDNIFLVPCGHCSECILKRRKTWALRCNLEALYHSESSFITLTYDDEHYPSNFSEVKKDLKKFIKDIRNSGFKVRYFGCGERGSHGTHRMHCHIILFGFFPSDVEYSCESDSGEIIFTSKFIDNIWKKGISTVQFAGSNVGQYVAGYTSKKLGLKDGFQIQSTHPGIGWKFLNEHKDEILKYNHIYSENGSGSVPRYFEKIVDDDVVYQEQKKKRAETISKINYKLAREHNIHNIEQLSFMNKEHFDNILSLLERSL